MHRRPNRTTHCTRFRGTAAARVAAVALIATGCGDDDDASGDGTISRTAWVDQFDRICVAVTDELSRAESDMTGAEWTAFNIGGAPG
jgi:hypothetical protein